MLFVGIREGQTMRCFGQKLQMRSKWLMIADLGNGISHCSTNRSHELCHPCHWRIIEAIPLLLLFEVWYHLHDKSQYTIYLLAYLVVSLQSVKLLAVKKVLNRVMVSSRILIISCTSDVLLALPLPLVGFSSISNAAVEAIGIHEWTSSCCNTVYLPIKSITLPTTSSWITLGHKTSWTNWRWILKCWEHINNSNAFWTLKRSVSCIPIHAYVSQSKLSLTLYLLWLTVASCRISGWEIRATSSLRRPTPERESAGNGQSHTLTSGLYTSISHFGFRLHSSMVAVWIERIIRSAPSHWLDTFPYCNMTCSTYHLEIDLLKTPKLLSR